MSRAADHGDWGGDGNKLVLPRVAASVFVAVSSLFPRVISSQQTQVLVDTLSEPRERKND